MGHVGPLGKTLIFLSPLGSLTSYDFLSFLFILKLSYSKPFHNTLNYASTANIKEVMKFYNLGGNKSFETDFSLHSSIRELAVRACFLPRIGCISALMSSKLISSEDQQKFDNTWASSSKDSF